MSAKGGHTHTDYLVINALVKLRQRIAGDEVRLTQAEAQALYLMVLPQSTRADPVVAADAEESA